MLGSTHYEKLLYKNISWYIEQKEIVRSTSVGSDISYFHVQTVDHDQAALTRAA